MAVAGHNTELALHRHTHRHTHIHTQISITSIPRPCSVLSLSSEEANEETRKRLVGTEDVGQREEHR